MSQQQETPQQAAERIYPKLGNAPMTDHIIRAAEVAAYIRGREDERLAQNNSTEVRGCPTVDSLIKKAQVITFSCSKLIHVYYHNSPILPMPPYSSHSSIDSAKLWLLKYKRIQEPKIIYNGTE